MIDETNPTSGSLDLLTAKVCDGLASEEEHQELMKQLAASKGAQLRYLEHIVIHATLQDKLDDASLSNIPVALPAEDEDPLELPEDIVIGSIAPRRRRQKQRSSFPSWVAAACMAFRRAASW